MKKRLEARVQGIVQGVGFRFFVQRNAATLGLNGVARNEPDGSVSVTMEGEEADLNRMVEALRQGPRMARVDGVQYKVLQATGEFNGIEVE